MSKREDGPTAFWETVGWLLHHARLRSKARGEHQQKLLNHRASKTGVTDWGCLGVFIMFVFGMGLHGMAAYSVRGMADFIQRLGAEHEGKMAVSRSFLRDLEQAPEISVGRQRLVETKQRELEKLKKQARAEPRNTHVADGIRELEKQLRRLQTTVGEQGLKSRLDAAFRNESWKQAQAYGERGRDASERHIARLRMQHERLGKAGFVELDRWELGLAGHGELGHRVLFMGSVILLWWFVMLVFQGEGLEMDFQRRRHPMWEWLLSHPVHPGAVFLAEMLAPLATNPFILSAPVFWVGLVWQAYGSFGLAVLAGIAGGLPMAVAAACVSKALEVNAMLRLSMRSRGAVLGIMSWLGYATMVLLMAVAMMDKLQQMLARLLFPLTDVIDVSPLGWLLGLTGFGEPSLWKGVVLCWIVCAVIIALAVQFSAWATKAGLAGGFGGTVQVPLALDQVTRWRLLRDPVYRKELLWFLRDRGALVQVFLIPMTMAAGQLFNMRSLLELASGSWHIIAGAAVLFGTYFLFILGPRSLLSEGSALWIPLTWPRGLEDLLKTKARLWWICSSLLVVFVLALAALFFPEDGWRVALVGVGWFLFSGSLAEKTVTLVSAPSSSGEPEPVPAGRRWAASLGTFAFAIGVLSQQWSVAFVGIVYSWLTSAAMWQNFRARLPYLFDAWSERLPQPPTLMHSMIAISALSEGMAFIFGIALAALGKDHLMMGRAVAYGVAGLLALVVVSGWLRRRGVAVGALWRWASVSTSVTPQPEANESRLQRMWFSAAETTSSVGEDISHMVEQFCERLIGAMKNLGLGAGIGLALGLMGLGYSWLVQQLPELGAGFRETTEYWVKHPEERKWMFVMAVFFAPVAEEFLFRGLLYRALHREWGGWRAVWGSALFFAIYHPPLAWLPVALVGAVNAWLFRRTNCLETAVVVHMVYNAIVVLA